MRFLVVNCNTFLAIMYFIIYAPLIFITGFITLVIKDFSDFSFSGKIMAGDEKKVLAVQKKKKRKNNKKKVRIPPL